MESLENARSADEFLEAVVAEKSNFDKYIKNKVDKSNHHEREAEAYKNLANSSASKKVANAAMNKYETALKKSQEARNVNGHDAEVTNRIGDISRSVSNSRGGNKIPTSDIRSERRKTREKYKSPGTAPEEKYKANRYLDVQNAKNGK